MEVALFGNPNTGKTSLFNMLTGSCEFIGNWNGVTVEKKIGHLKNHLGTLVDLPGIYALSPLSKDESVAASFLLKNTFTMAVNIVDASQLLRNFQLTIELLEFGKPVIIGLNMVDVAKHKGMIIDHEKLSGLLHVPVIPIVARTGRGCRLIQSAMEPGSSDNQEYFKLNYGHVIEKAIQKLNVLFENEKMDRRWLAIQYLLNNQVVVDYLNKRMEMTEAESVVHDVSDYLKIKNPHLTVSQWIRQKRKAYIEEIISAAVQTQASSKPDWSDKLDMIVTHKILGIPLFLIILYLIFHVTFYWIGNPLSDLLNSFFSGPLTDWTGKALEWLGVMPFIRDVILNGIIAGVGGVLVFVPQIFVLFFFISWIEDSGYMARVALIMDRIMQLAGLNGKAFIPLVIGFGCNIPGIMAARSIEQPRERLITILITPLMSCSARLTVFSLFAGIFFTHYQALVVLSLYVLSIVIAMIMARVFSLFMKNEQSVFVVELPPYHIPDIRTILRGTWEKARGFVKKATTFILGGTVMIWLLSYAGPEGIHVRIDQSYLALICMAIAPIVGPIGFGTWQAASGLITGFLAKEAVVSTFAVVYHGTGSGTLTQALSSAFTPLQAYSFMVFLLLYTPCISTVPNIKREAGSVKLTLFTIGYSMLLAYTVSFVVFHIGRLLGFQ
ncbi:ferrous iron transport protein B [Sporolactobacillus sp. THM7-4]|nr:ferrous iron transport protein B [Sporolactobacillus sp. THM7-4]